MKRILFIIAPAFLIFSCKGKKDQEVMVVSGTITNNTARMIYLDEIPMATMQRMIADSALIGKDGKYTLKADKGEARVFSLRVDNNPTPLADIINDAAKINVDISFNKENAQYADYTVKGSAASTQMKDFLVAFNKGLESAYLIDLKADSLQKNNVSDSVLSALQTERKDVSGKINELARQAISKSQNPALTMIILGYYQSTANNPAYKLEPLATEEVSKIVNDLSARYPQHSGLALIKNSLDAEMNGSNGLVGQQAPEISLPDINGKEVKLSSFRGKYVLVDFWASWCSPCRAENPNVVKAYNRFKDKNFAILGVSLDRPGQKDAWMKAVMQDNLTWTQVSDLQFWNSVVVPLYHLEGIPYNVLVDPQGKIIAEALRGDALERKLDEVLQ